MRKCIRCRTDCFGSICPRCGADRIRAGQDTKYLLTLATQGLSYRMLRSAATMALTVSIFVFVAGLISGQFILSCLPVFLTSMGVIKMNTANRFSFPSPDGVDTEPDRNDAPSMAPARLFTASVIVRGVIIALAVAVCAAVCIGGKPVIDRIFSLYESGTGTSVSSMLASLSESVGVKISMETFYFSMYFTCSAGMFVFGLLLVFNAFELVFISSYRESIKCGRPVLRGMGLFFATLLINCIVSAFLALFTGGFIHILLFSVRAYLYGTAFAFFGGIRRFLA